MVHDRNEEGREKVRTSLKLLPLPSRRTAIVRGGGARVAAGSVRADRAGCRGINISRSRPRELEPSDKSSLTSPRWES